MKKRVSARRSRAIVAAGWISTVAATPKGAIGKAEVVFRIKNY
jgi:hypothetical protein